MSTTLSSLYSPMMASPAMRAICDDRAYLQAMLDVEAGLARALADLNIIPIGAVEPIRRACEVSHYDIAALADAGIDAGNLAIPLVRALTAEVRMHDTDAAGYVHWGATSQDIIDSAMMLTVRAALDALNLDLKRAIAGFARLAETHRHTATVGRTWLQHALPMPFGLKLAGYAVSLHRSKLQLARLRREALATGTRAARGARGGEVAERLAARLDLPLPEAPWHTHRDRVADIAAQFAILTGSCGKIARDVSLLMQTDVAEAFEPAGEGRGGSSTMPHKRNPVSCAIALSAATMAPNLAATIFAAQVQDHERSAGPWHAEWPTLPMLMLVTSGALAAVGNIAEGLQIDVAQMRHNLDATSGLIMAEAVTMALAETIGTADAHHLVEAASRRALHDKRHLREILADDSAVTAHLDRERLASLFEPMNYQGVAQQMIDRMLASLA